MVGGRRNLNFSLTKTGVVDEQSFSHTERGHKMFG